ncbi:ArnT family glycosyltransferase [Parvularcula maris]|uniref:Glycosyltransferase family 39 protein n=1 Tax=Parvularcula maris TaxID=2965077 RepID=A0A9X2RIN9_9PROT|nr:glycosyltransferase family 39 protein [Parvularcula maris]MCQ8186224.1 glycosyltransferase family 39 protein [Parvularcula maris]
MTPLGTGFRPAGKLGIAQGLFVLWICALALFPGQWTMPVTDRDEARYSQAATQMMETGDYVDIRFQEDPRYVKPAGIYWMQVASTQPFGGPDAPIGAYRIPSFLGVLLTSLVTAMIGARAFGGAAGALAGVLLSLTLLAGADARMAKTDSMLMLTGTLSSLALFQILVQPKGSPARQFRGWPLVFWLANGLAVLIKGPIISIMTVLTILFYVAFTRDWRALRRLRPLPGLLVFALVGFSWIALITFQTEGEFLRESVGHAFLGKVAEGDDDHGGWPFYHTSMLAVMFWPGTALLGLGVAAAWVRRREPAMVFLLSWLVPFFVVYEIVGTKLPHYVLPVYPALALLCGLGVKEAPRLLSGFGGKLVHGLFLLIFILGCAALAGGLWYGVQDLEGEMTVWIWATIGTLIAAALASILFLRKPSFSGATYAALPIVAFYAVFGGVALPRFEPMWPSHGIWQIAQRIEGCERINAATAGYREPSNVFYLGTKTELTDGEGAAAFLRRNRRCGLAVVEAREMETFTAAYGRPVRSLGTVRGTNVSKGRAMELQLLVAEDSPLRLGDTRQGRL